MNARRHLGATAGAAILLLCVASTPALGDGVVSGTVSAGDPARRPPPPQRSRGFVARAPNPLKPPQPFNPLPYVVVILDGGPVAGDARKPPREPVRYTILGEAFAAPVMPVVTGSTIEIKNAGKRAPRVHAPANPDVMLGEAINPKAGTLIKKLDLEFAALQLRDRDSAHLSGWIVGVPHPYFATVDAEGKFQIKGVPPGEWKARLWYRDAWLPGAGEKVVVVAGRDAAVKLALPAELPPEPAPVAPPAPAADEAAPAADEAAPAATDEAAPAATDEAP